MQNNLGMIAAYDIYDAETGEIVAHDVPAIDLPQWVPEDRTRSYRIRAKGIGPWGSIRTFPEPTMDETGVTMDQGDDARTS